MLNFLLRSAVALFSYVVSAFSISLTMVYTSNRPCKNFKIINIQVYLVVGLWIPLTILVEITNSLDKKKFIMNVACRTKIVR